MHFDDLGPLERAVLSALALAEGLDAPLTTASIWRTLPGYRTTLPNVRAALAPHAPLRAWVEEFMDSYVLRDRTDSLSSLGARQGLSDARWRELKGPLRGLAKLPWVEAVGIGGSMAWGLLPDASSRVDLVVIAEGGRAPLVQVAVGAWITASRQSERVRLAAVVDGDALELRPGSLHAAWWLMAIRPVSNEPAFDRLWAANPWATALFPNHDTESTGGLPEYLLAERLDGRLARLRRALVAKDDDGVLLTSTGRKPGRIERRLVAVAPPLPSRAWFDGRGEAAASAHAARCAEVARWELGSAPLTEPDEVTQESTSAPAVSPASVQSSRSRGPTPRRAGGARAARGRSSVASPEHGQGRRR